MGAHVTYLIPGKRIGLDRLLKSCPGQFGASKILAVQSVITYYDTFDWRLFKKAHVLSNEDDQWRLASANGDKELRAGPLAEKKYYFADDFPEGELRKLLEKTTSPRALIPYLRLKRSAKQISLLNKDDKTVSRLSFSSHRLLGSGRKPLNIKLLGELHEVKGYERENAEVLEFMISHGFKVQPEGWSVHGEMAKRASIEPGNYSAKIGVELSEFMTAREAALVIIRSLLDAAERNVNGIKGDIDTEFLHEFRVAIRRLRTLLGQFKKVFPQETVNSLKTSLSYLGGLSNKTRDLDVYLISKKDYAKMLTENLRAGLEDFFGIIGESRKIEFDAMNAELASQRYTDAVNAVRGLLKGAGSLPESENSLKPVKEIAKHFIMRKFQKILLMAGEIANEMSDEDLHRLRISCKHLRYLIEFFSSLFPPEEIAEIVGNLKNLQDHLGFYNDFSVQQRYIAEQLDAYIGSNGGASGALAASLGGLMVGVDEEKRRSRGGIVEAFGRFCSKKNVKSFRRLFQ